MLGLHIVSFTDATLATLSWSHVLLDDMRRKALLDAWSLVLQGREDEVLPLHGVETDPMATLGTHPTELYQHVDKAVEHLADDDFRLAIRLRPDLLAAKGRKSSHLRAGGLCAITTQRRSGRYHRSKQR